MRRRVPGPSRIIQHGTGQPDHVRIPGCDDRFRMFEIADQPHRDHGNAQGLPQAAGEGNLIARSDRNRRFRVDAALETLIAAQPRASSALAKAIVLSRSSRRESNPSRKRGGSPACLPGTPRAPFRTPRAGIACGFRGCRHTHPGAGSKSATGSYAADSHAPHGSGCHQPQPRGAPGRVGEGEANPLHAGMVERFRGGDHTAIIGMALGPNRLPAICGIRRQLPPPRRAVPKTPCGRHDRAG